MVRFKVNMITYSNSGFRYLHDQMNNQFYQIFFYLSIRDTVIYTVPAQRRVGTLAKHLVRPAQCTLQYWTSEICF